MAGLVDKAIAKCNKNELCRRGNLFNTAYCHYTLLSEIQIKMFVLTLLNFISDVTIDHDGEARWINSTDSCH